MAISRLFSWRFFVLIWSAKILISIHAGQVTLAWDPSPDAGVAKYRLYRGGAANSYDTVVDLSATATNAIVTNLVAGSVYYFAVTAVDAYGAESDYSNVVGYTVAGTSSGPLANSITVSTLEDQSVAVLLSGSDPQNDPLTFRTQTLPANGILSGTPPNLIYRPNVNFFGTDSFTYAASDATSTSAAATVTINVTPQNDVPTLNVIASITVYPNSGTMAVPLSGITSGAANEAQTLSVTASSSNPSLITPTVTYTSPSAIGSLSLRPGSMTGTATITVTVNDGQSANNLLQRTFLISVITAPPVISYLTEQSNDARTLTLGWTTDQSTTCTVEFGPTTSLGLISSQSFGTSHTATLPNLQPATTYYVRVRASNSSGGTSLSSTATAATEPIIPILFAAESAEEIPSMFAYPDSTAQNGQYISAKSSSGKAVFTLNVPDGLNYRLWSRVKPPVGGGSLYVSVDGGPETLVTVPQNGAANSWRWLLLSSASGSGSSPLVLPLGAGAHKMTIRTGIAQTMMDEFALCNDPQWQPILPTTKPVLALSTPSTTSVNLSWVTKAGNADSVAIECSLDGVNFFGIATVPATSTSLPVQNLLATSAYYFRIRVFNAVDTTDYSSVAVRPRLL
jgi:fibronectin type 3 domain-containing protein